MTRASQKVSDLAKSPCTTGNRVCTLRFVRRRVPPMGQIRRLPQGNATHWIASVVAAWILGAMAAPAADFVLAVDVSGSMRWNEAGQRIPPGVGPSRIEIIRPALERYLESLPDDSRVYLLSFNDGIVDKDEFLLSQPGRRDAMREWVARLNPPSDSKTHLWATLRKALQQARVYANEAKGSWVTIRVLTDGENHHPGADLTLTKVLDEFPEIEKGQMIPDLVLLGSLKQEFLVPIEAEAKKPRVVKINPGLMEEAFPPVIKWSPDPIMAGQRTTFFDNAKAAFKTYRWLVDGREVGQDRSFEWVPGKPGSAIVRVEVLRRDGSRDAAQRTVEVVTEPVRAAIFVPATATAGEGVAFVSRSSGKIATQQWFVGGRVVSENPEHSHVFESPGSHEVKLIVRDALGNTDEAARTIAVGTKPPPPPAPVAAFKVMGERWKAGESIQFMDESSGIVGTRRWDFNGDGTSADHNPVFAFKTPGAKTISLVAEGPGGKSRAEQKIDVVPRHLQPKPAFTASPKSGKIPLTVRFAAQIEGDYDSVEWNFGDGATSQEANPQHTYTNAGTFDPALIARHGSGLEGRNAAGPRIRTTEPLPRWVWPSVGALLAGLVAWLLYLKLRPPLLEGRVLLRSASGATKDIELDGRNPLVLNRAGLPGWEPKHRYSLRHDRDVGMVLEIFEGEKKTEQRPLGRTHKADLEGARFEYRN